MVRVAMRVGVIVRGLALGLGLAGGRLACTVFATTEKREVVAIELEALGGQLFKVTAAAGKLKDAAAVVAVKVMVVALAGKLVARALAWDVDGQHFIGINEQLERPIDGRKAEPVCFFRGEVKDLAR